MEPSASPTVAAQIPLFRRLPAGDMRLLDEQLQRSSRHADAGQVIAERGSPMEMLLILIDGNAHAEIVSGEGQTMNVESFRGPEVIASAMLFAPKPHLPVSLVADSECTYTTLPRDFLLDLCQRHRSVLEALLGDVGRRTAFLAARLRLAQFASLRQRIAVYISEAKARVDRNGVEYIHVSHTRQELADMFGVARPSLSRELGRMCDEGLIWTDGSTIQVMDRGAIETLVTGCE